MTAFLAFRGFDVDTMDKGLLDQILAMVVWGSPDEVGERLAGVIDLGVDGITCSLPGNGWNPDRVELLGETAAKAVARLAQASSAGTSAFHKRPPSTPPTIGKTMNTHS